MNYIKIHDQIIKSARENPPTGRHEIHHIIPRSMGGSDDMDNLIALTYRQHYIIHWLLIKIHPNNPLLWYAFHMMNHQSSYSNRPEEEIQKRLRSNAYKINKERLAEALSDRMKGLAKTEEHKEQMSKGAVERWQRPGEREKQAARFIGNKSGEKNKGKKRGPEIVEKQRIALLEWYKTHPSAQKGIKKSPEIGAKISASKKLNPRIWTEEEKIAQSIRIKAENRKQSDYQKAAVADANSDTWEVTTPAEEKLIIKNLRQFCKLHNLSQGNLITHGKTKGFRAVKITKE